MSKGRRLEVLAFAGLFGHAAMAADFALDPLRLDKSAVRYRDRAQVSEFPTPAVYFRAAGLSAGATEFAEIREKILYPLIEKSRKPISAIIVQWFPGQPDGLAVIILWSDGEARESTVARDPAGHYDPAAHEILLAKPTP
jgi:hypothetical protein